MDSECEARVIDSAIQLAEVRGWAATTWAAIATAAGLPLADLRRAFPTKTAILIRLMARTDSTVLAGTPVWSERDSARDRLFEILMRRFDALRDYRRGLAAILRALPADPPAALALGKALDVSMAWTLAAAGLEAGGAAGRVQGIGLAGIYLCSLRIWLNDATPDLARTMAALDSGLRRAESLVALCRPGGDGGRCGVAESSCCGAQK